MNKFSAYGRITKDPELKEFKTNNNPDGCVVNFSIAVKDGLDADGKPKTQFIPCQAWNNTARFIKSYIKKGDPIGVTGKLISNDYTDKNNVKHYSYIINVDDAECILEPTGEAAEPQPEPTRSTRQYSRSGRR